MAPTRALARTRVPGDVVDGDNETLRGIERTTEEWWRKPSTFDEVVKQHYAETVNRILSDTNRMFWKIRWSHEAQCLRCRASHHGDAGSVRDHHSEWCEKMPWPARPRRWLRDHTPRRLAIRLWNWIRRRVFTPLCTRCEGHTPEDDWD